MFSLGLEAYAVEGGHVVSALEKFIQHVLNTSEPTSSKTEKPHEVINQRNKGSFYTLHACVSDIASFPR